MNKKNTNEYVKKISEVLDDKIKTRNLNTFKNQKSRKPLKNGYFFVKFCILTLHTSAYV